jgi:hypothetical protein
MLVLKGIQGRRQPGNVVEEIMCMLRFLLLAFSSLIRIGRRVVILSGRYCV